MVFLNRMSSVFRRAENFYREQTGQSLVLVFVLFLLSVLAQIVFRRELAPGEFGTLNTVLGLIGLMTVPVIAVDRALAWYLSRIHAPARDHSLVALRDASLPILEMSAWAWAALTLVLLFPVLSLLDLPRFSLGLFALLNIFIALAGVVSGAICDQLRQARFWAGLLLAAAVIRLLAGGLLAHYEPWSESVLAAFILGGFIILVPVLRQAPIEIEARIRAVQAILDRDFLIYLGATFSVLLAVFLFSSADRIIAQSWFGSPSPDNAGTLKDYVNWPAFDAYQSAGLLGRSLLWGTQPLLLIFFAQRSRLEKSTSASLLWFWIYLGALITGVILLILLRQPVSRWFCGTDFAPTAGLVPVFALAMIPLGLLHGLSFFALASRRYPECFVLGG